MVRVEAFQEVAIVYCSTGVGKKQGFSNLSKEMPVPMEQRVMRGLFGMVSETIKAERK